MFAQQRLLLLKRLSSSQGVSSLTSLMDVWYDRSYIELSETERQLVDMSGNGRGATLTSNLMTLGDLALNKTSWASTGGSALALSVNDMITSDLAPAFTTTAGTSTMRFRWVAGGSVTLGVKSQNYVTKAGDQITVRFKFKRDSATNYSFTSRKGNGFNAGGTVNLSLATNLIGGSQAVGSWGQYEISYTDDIGGGLATALITASAGAGTHTIYIDRDVTVTVNGEEFNCFILPQDATLKATDAVQSKYCFYTSEGVSLTTRGQWQYNSLIPQIYCGGASSYIFLKSAIITPGNEKIIADNFEDLDHAFDSCPIIPLTVGSGGTYSSIYAAISVATTGVPDFRHRRPIQVLSDQTVTTYAGYTATSGGGFKAYIHMSRAFDYIYAVGGTKTITATKEVSLNDAQSGGTEVWAPVYSGGIRGFNTQKSNGGYVWHQDFTGNIDSHLIIKNCTFEDNGAQGIYDYRIANAQPAPAGALTGAAQTGGMQDRFFLKVSNVRLASIFAFTWQDAQVTNGTGGTAYYRDCVLESKPLYDLINNSTSTVKENIRLTSSGGTRNTTIYLQNATKNSTINKVGAVESIFISEV